MVMKLALLVSVETTTMHMSFMQRKITGMLFDYFKPAIYHGYFKPSAIYYVSHNFFLEFDQVCIDLFLYV